MRRCFSRPFLPVGFCGLLLTFSVSSACGPDFPNAYLTNSLDEIASLPSLDFESEVARVFPRDVLPNVDESIDEKAEVAEIREALAATGLAPVTVEAVADNYRRDFPPTQLPLEFQLYARGAKAWHDAKVDDAVAAWRELLALPEKQRHYRTVWAAFMIGRSIGDCDVAAIREACHRTQEAAAHGFADSQKLAAASLGWEARTYFLEGAYGDALRLYARQFQLGVPSATASLQFTVRRAFGRKVSAESLAEATPGSGKLTPSDVTASIHELSEIANDPSLRGLVTAWFVSRGGPRAPWNQEDEKEFMRWIHTLRDTRDLTAAESDRWCWAAYQNGLWDDAAKLASQAPADAPAAEWVRAMLLLRQGFVDDATAHLAKAAKAFPKDPSAAPLQPQSSYYYYDTNNDAPVTRLAGIRGTLALRREQVAESLHLFVEAGHWSDAAYVAEQVLTLDELTEFVRANSPAAPAPSALSPLSDNWRPLVPAANLRHLLARRLAREAHFDQAREFFPEEMRVPYDTYVKSIRTGYDEKRPAAERAAGFWLGAQTVLKQGMELIGTELEPDYAIWGGSFQWPDFRHMRNVEGNRYYGDERSPGVAWVKAAGAIAPSSLEYERAEKARVPLHRYHYRYRAAELAWLGASLLPNDDPRTALMLNTAGRWVAPHDPERADLFYKTLVLRCPHTDLGKAAAERHWLVPEEKEAEGGRQ